jgi:pullulanase/glycogen debranching enzyme
MGRQAVVALPEHIDASNASQIRVELLWVINRGADTLIADMTATLSCDQSGADAVMRAYQRALASGTQLRLAVTDAGTNFAVASEVANGMMLCLFGQAGTETQVLMRDYDAGVWHVLVPGVGPGQAYGYRTTGPWGPGPRHPAPRPPTLRWYTPAGAGMTGADWADPNALAIALYLDGSDDPDRAADGTWLIDDYFLVLVNAWWEPLDFTLPDTRPQAGWRVQIDTYDPGSQADPAAADRKAGDHVTVGPRSVAVLKNPRPAERGGGTAP